MIIGVVTKTIKVAYTYGLFISVYKTQVLFSTSY